jgi:hypothetical protein
MEYRPGLVLRGNEGQDWLADVLPKLGFRAVLRTGPLSQAPPVAQAVRERLFISSFHILECPRA